MKGGTDEKEGEGMGLERKREGRTRGGRKERTEVGREGNDLRPTWI